MKRKETVDRSESFQFVEKLGSGYNIGNSLDCYGTGKYEDIYAYECSWGNAAVTKELIDAIAEIGFQTIRIPVTWQEHLQEDGAIEEAWLERIRLLVDAAYEDGLYVIIDVHHDVWSNPVYANLYHSLKMTRSVWGQIAEYFREYDEHLLFEGFNEIRLIGTEQEWTSATDEANFVINRLMASFVSTVRGAGGYNKTRYLLVSGYCSGISEAQLAGLKIPEDEHLLLSVHMYLPYSFAANVDGEGIFSNEVKADLEDGFEYITSFSKKNSIPVVVTEYGAVVLPQDSERVAWADYITQLFQKNGFAYLWWDNGMTEGNHEAYALLNRNTLEICYPDVVDVIKQK